ncbi:putative transcription factor GRF family [Helianthus anomalus]
MVMCRCGRQTGIKTSWTDINPGRQFYTCVQLRSRCKFFAWIDPPMCPRSVQVIRGLMDTKVVLENEVKFLREEVRMYKEQVAEMENKNPRVVLNRDTCLIICWILFFFCPYLYLSLAVFKFMQLM